ncbi:Coenzyme F420 hydrogenase/dehydrogenase, beta subunit C-terminal domain [Actinoplanes sp. NPDC049548]|uniref:Coenzyme F420 hydrogenase/dehydrogenase, beta subunit C-terminal domain n=1 Tax=Actinoplanes sp. NPDC049548 TaxID=3155152 RepID=UPI00342699A8
MSFADLSAVVLEPGLCTACGACSLACPADVIGFEGLEPVAAPNWTAADCGSCTDCLDACPGADPGTPEAEVRLFGRTRTDAERWLGVYTEVLGGRSARPEVFAASASGGSITALLQATAAELGVTVFLTMGRDAASPWRAAPSLTEDSAHLVETAQSTYQLAPYLNELRTVYRDAPSARVAMTGTACHIQAMRKLQAMDTPIGRWARDHVVFLIEPACSSSTRPEGTVSIVETLARLPLESVTRLRYREGEYPGAVRIRTADGAEHEVEFWRAVRDLARNKTHRCLSCGDWVSGLADVSVSDGDPNIFAASLGEGRAAKHGRVFVRTQTGARVVAAAAEQGLFEHWPIDLSGLNLGLERKRHRRTDYERSGKPIPLGPIPGYHEQIEVISDERLISPGGAE